MYEDNVLEFSHIRKLYPGVQALKDISISFKKGEVHALIGENGAGKSTLIKTASGAETPTSGTIRVNDTDFNRLTPIISQENGITVIYQELNLVSELSVWENVFLGNPLLKHGMVDKKAMMRKCREILTELEIDMDCNTLTGELTVGYQQMVEIAKALSRETKILVMDEPSASLTTTEVKKLFQIVKKLKKSGITIIYISHRLDEIFELADRVTVFRDGEWITTLQTSETNRQELISLMVGRDLSETYPESLEPQGDVILQVKNLCGNGVRDVNFELRAGEILGLGGLIGAGRTETAQIICGVAKKTAGQILLNGRQIIPKNPRDAIEMGIAMAPEDRKRQGLMLHMSVEENIVFPSYKQLSAMNIIRSRACKDIVNQYLGVLKIKTPSGKELARNLSGGNQQKTVLAKWLAKSPSIIILDEPTRGVDVGAKQEIYTIMRDLTKSGKAIIMISSDMEELLGMSDRIVVFCDGRVTGELSKQEVSQEAVLALASLFE